MSQAVTVTPSRITIKDEENTIELRKVEGNWTLAEGRILSGEDQPPLGSARQIIQRIAREIDACQACGIDWDDGLYSQMSEWRDDLLGIFLEESLRSLVDEKASVPLDELGEMLDKVLDNGCRASRQIAQITRHLAVYTKTGKFNYKES